MIDEKKLTEDIDNCVAGLTNIQIMQIADIIESQPKVGEWIPCKRELPKTNGVYQITRELKIGEDICRISDSAYFDGQDTWHNDNRYNHVRLPLTDIVAWKPLDEPYKEEVNQ